MTRQSPDPEQNASSQIGADGAGMTLRRKKSPKRILAVPDLEHVKAAVRASASLPRNTRLRAAGGRDVVSILSLVRLLVGDMPLSRLH